MTLLCLLLIVNAVMRRKMENLIRNSFLDASYPVDEHWQLTTVQRLHDFQFASAYRLVMVMSGCNLPVDIIGHLRD